MPSTLNEDVDGSIDGKARSSRVHLTRYHGVFAPPRAARGDHAGGPRSRPASGRRRAARSEAPRDDLGATAQESIRDRHRDLPALRRQAQGDREHRGSRRHRADPQASCAAARDRAAPLAVPPACTARPIPALLTVACLTPPAPDFPKVRWRGCAWRSQPRVISGLNAEIRTQGRSARALSSAHGDRFHWIRVPRRPRRARAL